MSDWISPNPDDVQQNVYVEPEGERLRSELVEWLNTNRIVSILMDTPGHSVDIWVEPKLPNNIKPVLTKWGSIYIDVTPGPSPAPEKP